MKRSGENCDAAKEIHADCNLFPASKPLVSSAQSRFPTRSRLSQVQMTHEAGRLKQGLEITSHLSGLLQEQRAETHQPSRARPLGRCAITSGGPPCFERGIRGRVTKGDLRGVQIRLLPSKQMQVGEIVFLSSVFLLMKHVHPLKQGGDYHWLFVAVGTRRWMPVVKNDW